MAVRYLRWSSQCTPQRQDDVAMPGRQVVGFNGVRGGMALV